MVKLQKVEITNVHSYVSILIIQYGVYKVQQPDTNIRHCFTATNKNIPA